MSRSDYQFFDTNAAAIESDLINLYEHLSGVTVTPASPEKLFISWVASILVQAYVKMNYIGNQNIPSRASGDALDALGDMFYSVSRPQASAASCTERFNISEAQIVDITIPAGTRVTDASRTIIWETTEAVTILAGDTYADVEIICQTTGTVGNGYTAGQINTIVDVFEYYASCANTTTSSGGTDKATDEEYYQLLKSSLDAFSTAGPFGAYIFHAKSVSPQIADVKVIRPRKTVTAELPVHGGYAYMGGAGLLLDTLEIDNAAPLDDYNVTYENDLLEIQIDATGSLKNAETIEVSIVKNCAGEVEIYALMSDGTAAGSTVKAAIAAACNDSKVRPLTDKVTVKDPQIKHYTVNMTYYTAEDVTASSAEISAAVTAAVNEYKAWQSAKLGRDVNPSKLVQLVMETGLVKRVDCSAPSYEHIGDGSNGAAPVLAQCDSTTITNGGAEDE